MICTLDGVVGPQGRGRAVNVTQSKNTFSDLELAQLDSVFESVCSKVKPVRDLDEETKVAIRRRLFVLACNGMWDDLAALRDHLVLNFTRSTARNFARGVAKGKLGPCDLNECRQRAMMCDRLALESSSPIARERYYDLAKSWLAMAVQVERRLALLDKWEDQRRAPEKA